MTRYGGITAAVLALFVSGSTANTPVPKPTCDASKTVSVRYSSTSRRIYLESVDGSRGGCATPGGVYESLGAASPLYPLETPGEWMLDESLYILDGIVLQVHGTDVGGDCDYLKLRSDADTIVNVRAHGGSLDIVNTKVTSWDPSAGDVDTDWADGRSYLSAISEVVLDPAETCQGAAKNNMGEARMDIENSEIAYLGYEAAESWGVSWKLRGMCNDKSNRDLYQGIGVYGNLLGSDVHHLYYGHYGYAQLYALLSGNKVHDNEVYGFDPHDDSINITISDNDVYFNFHHGIIFSKYCHNTVVTGNHVHDNGGVGIFPHFVSDNTLIAHNTVESNGDSGIAFLESSGGLVHDNTVRNNVHGIRFSVGSRNNVVADNTFEDNQGYDFYQYEGNDPVAEVDSGHPTNNVLFANTFTGNVGGARLDDSVDTQFVANTVQDWQDFEFRDSVNTLLAGNTFPAGMTYTSTDSCFNPSSSPDLSTASSAELCSSEPAAAATATVFGQTDLDKLLGAESPAESHELFTETPTGAPTPSPATPLVHSASPTEVARSSSPTTENCGEGGGRDDARDGGASTASPTPTRDDPDTLGQTSSATQAARSGEASSRAEYNRVMTWALPLLILVSVFNKSVRYV